MRSEITIDLGALRRNVATLLRALDGAELWAVVKANGVRPRRGRLRRARRSTPARPRSASRRSREALALRRELPTRAHPRPRPDVDREVAQAREARLELVVAAATIPEGVPVHVKLDTGMGRWGVSELPSPTRDVVGVMTHLATADSDLDFARVQIERFREATEPLAAPHAPRREQRRGAAAARVALRRRALRDRALRPLAVRHRPRRRRARAGALVAERDRAVASCCARGESTGYGRRFVAERDTWIGIVPVGYADGFRRDLTGTEVRRRRASARRVVGTVSMDAFAVELDRELPPGTPVTLVGPGVPLEEHARVAGTITYELACGIDSVARRARTAGRP